MLAFSEMNCAITLAMDFVRRSIVCNEIREDNLSFAQIRCLAVKPQAGLNLS